MAMLFRVQPLPQLSSKTFEAFSPELVTLKNQVQFVPSVSLSYFLRAWGATSKILSHNGEDQIAKRGREWMDCVRGQAFFFCVAFRCSRAPPAPASRAISTCKTATWSRLMKWQQNCLPRTNMNWTFASVMVTWKKVRLQGHTPWPPLEFS